jgi:alkylation response protein AidB-like acyl-CoA dehydrogenase
MWQYVPPLQSIRFVIDEVLQAPAQWAEIPAFAELDADMAAQVIEEAGRFAAEVLQPTNGAGDLEGCRLDQGEVRVPAAYRTAYRAFVDGGWPSLACEPEVGGQGLPQLLNAVLFEMLVSANHGWSMYPGLLHGAYETLKSHGSPALRERYLPKIVSGEWLAAMALTEPAAGSDLGLLRTRAEPQADGSLKVRGSKIFISGGDHDLTDNIVHLVLCRLPEAPAGSKGLSLALVPKVLPDGTRNAVFCDGLEKKMGIKGSATCQMRYDGATGWLIGEPHRGLAAMFLMMNAARLHVGLQGVGHLEMATQNAVRYAHERRQLRAPSRPDGAAAQGPDLIAHHPAMRRTLLRLQAVTEGLRVVAYRAAQLIDEAEHHPDADRRREAQSLAALLTPVVKAFCTQQGFDGASAALQVWGGYGYTHDCGVEQVVRDARIALIYEGTNEIQAIDLVQRKLLADGGRAFETLLDQVAEAAEGAPAALCPWADALTAQVRQAREAVAGLRAATAEDAEAPLRVADDVLAGIGHLLLAWAWCASARALLRLDVPDDDARWAPLRHAASWLTADAGPYWQRVRQCRQPLGWLAPA